MTHSFRLRQIFQKKNLRKSNTASSGGRRWVASWVDGAVSVDNNHIENLMRPWAMGRKAWLFAGSESAGKRAAVVMSLVQSARLHGHDPWVYLRDVLERLLSHPNHRIDELLPHRWNPSTKLRPDGTAGRLRGTGRIQCNKWLLPIVAPQKTRPE